MTFEEFMSKLLKPTYVWRMASGVAGFQGRLDHEDQRPLVRSARTRMRNARRAIDDLVLQRAQTIADERRCAAVKLHYQSESRPDLAVRCEFPRGHGPVYGRRVTPGGLTMHDQQFDHAAPSRGVWWSAPEEAHA